MFNVPLLSTLQLQLLIVALAYFMLTLPVAYVRLVHATVNKK